MRSPRSTVRKNTWRRLIACAAVASPAIAGALLTFAANPATAPSTRPSPSAAAASTRPATAPSTPQIEALLLQLSNPDWRVRDRSVAGLIRIGVPAQPRLQEFIAATQNIEARDRALVVLEQLETLRRLGPSRITLHLKNATPQAAFQELSRQGHVLIRAWRPSLWTNRDYPPITLELQDSPFWEAMREVCVASELKPLFDNSDGESLVLQPDLNHDMKCPHTTSGAFTIMLSSLSHRRNIAAGADQKTGDGELLLSFFVDPRWRVMGYPGQTDFSAQLPDGTSLFAREPMAIQGFREHSPMWLMRGTLEKVPVAAKRLTQVSGSFKVTLLEMSELREINNVMEAGGTLSRCGGHSLQLASIQKLGEGYKVHCVVTRAGLSDQPWRGEMEGQAIQLIDADGRPLQRSETQNQQAGDQVSYDLSFTPGRNQTKPPAKLAWQIPLEQHELTVSFQLDDLTFEK